MRKSAFLTTGNDSFRFNFNLDPQDVDQGPSDDKNTPDSNAENLEVANTSKVNYSNSNTEISEKNSNNFKFYFSESQFKFNFNVNG